MVRKNAIEIDLVHSEGKPVVAEVFTRTLKNEIHKDMTSISKIFILIN